VPGDRVSAAGAAGQVGAGHAGRVATVHRQARVTLVLAAAFVPAAGLAALADPRTGRWLPLHLLLVGGLLGAISGVTQLLAVTWSSSPAPPDAAVRAQRAALAVGAVGLALARELDAVTLVTALAGALVLLALALLAGLLAWIRRHALLDRFHPAIDGYLAAIGLGVVASLGGVVLAGDWMATRTVALRSAHLTTNLLGLVGLVVASTLPYFVATQARTKMAPHASVGALRATFGVLVAAVMAIGVGHLFEWRPVAIGGYGLYLVGIVGVVALSPRVGRRQLRWAGPRLVMVGAGIAWWAAAVGALGLAARRGDPPPDGALVVLVVGGYAQILVGSLAYLGPVLRGGGHERLAAGFRTTRSWTVLVAANVAAVSIAVGAATVAAVALTVALAEVVVRAAVLMRPG
jgi:hypothetical protein